MQWTTNEDIYQNIRNCSEKVSKTFQGGRRVERPAFKSLKLRMKCCFLPDMAGLSYKLLLILSFVTVKITLVPLRLICYVLKNFNY